ncbi:hypothetical protein WSM22_31990 [Cytophagales bacterium WSM2-2]|nr:hypothetical protein WSM22_31990 [Cytophagales bacterium WSM2-2]
MNRRTFIVSTGILSGVFAFSNLFAKKKSMTFHFLRHATFILEVNNIRILVDPMLGAKDSMDPVKITRNNFRIPMINLPLTEEQLTRELKTIDAVIVTHTHRDHWDEKSRQLLPKNIDIIGQSTDQETLTTQGFTNLHLIDSSIEFKGLKITRTGGQHGTGEIGKRMGNVSGFVIEFNNQKIYIAGDTIWCPEVEQALATHRPDFTVLNAGAARFDQGDPITMTAEDVMKVSEKLSSTKVIAVHMETVNHCDLKRDEIKKILSGKGIRALIPVDGEKISL